MHDWQVLSRSQHAHYGWLPRTGFAFTREWRTLPVLLAELPQLMDDYVLAFTRDAQGVTPVALLDIGLDANLYLHPDGRWLARYVPAELRALPFALRATQGGQHVLSIADDHLSEADEARPLFDDQGQLCEEPQRAGEFLQQREAQRGLTQRACKQLDELGLIAPWPLQVRLDPDVESVELEGLYRIDEQALNALDAKPLAELRDSAALRLAYLQPVSSLQLRRLVDRGSYLARLDSARGEETPHDSLDSLFEEGDDFTFDFDA